MIGLHETMSIEGAFRLSDIIRIGAPRVATPGHVETCFVEMGAGRNRELLESEFEAVMCRPVQLLPAEPGTSHIWGGVDRAEVGGEYWVATTPVIAWALCLDGEVRFVTARGVNDGSTRRYDEYYVEMPDGSVQGAGRDYEHPFFTDREAYRAHIVATVSALVEVAREQDASGSDGRG